MACLMRSFGITPSSGTSEWLGVASVPDSRSAWEKLSSNSCRCAALRLTAMTSTECGGSPVNLASFQVWFTAVGFAHAATSTMVNATRSAAHLTSIPGSRASAPVHRTVGEPIFESFEPEAENDHRDAAHDREG